ncbi:MAG: alpha-2-macroglobulin family protein, partial [Pseudomonadota bacterium]
RLDAAGGGAVEIALPQAAARGVWRLTVELDGVGVVGRTSLSVEDFVPQRVALELEAADTPALGVGDTRLVTAKARFLYGAPGAGLPVTGRARVQLDPRPFAAWEGYSFGRHDERFAEVLFTLPKVTTDGEGRATLPIAIEARGKEATKPLRVRAVVEVEEPGGRAVADDVRLPYRPRDLYWGMKGDFDGSVERQKESQFAVVAVNRNGAAVAAQADWALTRRDFDYDWYRTPGGDWRWRRSERIVPIEEGIIAVADGATATVSLPPLDWGDYTLSLSQDGQEVASSGFWVGWRGRTVSGVEAPDEVRVVGADAPASIGAETTISIRPPYAGEAEIVVATDRVLSTQHITVNADGTDVALPVTEEWGAGAYVMVTVYTPRDAATSPKPRRAVGVAYLPTDVGPKTFNVVLDVPDIAEPNQTLTLPIEVTNGPQREAVYATIAAVDEGILQLTKFKSPTPTDWFFGKTRLGVALYDDYGRLLDPNQGAAAPTRSGGDQIGGAGLSVVPTKTVALFSGIVSLDGRGRATVPVTLPDFNGELRLMAVAWSETGVGNSSQSLTVRDDVPAELILPRFLAPGDEAAATLTVDNVAGAAGDYAISFAADGPLTAPTDIMNLTLGEKERTENAVTIRANGEGVGTVALNVNGPGNFEVASNYPIEVRSAFLPVTRATTRVLKPGEAYTPRGALLSGYEPGSSALQVSVAASPIDTSSLFQSLTTYPYQCTEQMVSRAMPALYIEGVSALMGDKSPEKTGRSVRQAVETLLSRQSRGGAIGLWRQGDRQASPWIGAYAADFITRAAAEGYPVPEEAKKRALDALQPIAQGQVYRSSGYKVTVPQPRWTSDTKDRLLHRSSAYALYVLAREGRADRSRLRYMHDALIDKIESPLARAHIGAGLAALGDKGRATSAFEKAVAALGYSNKGDWYQTPRRDLAAVLALAAEAGMTDIAVSLTERVTADLPEPARLTTQEKAHLLLAARALTNGEEIAPVSYSKDTPNPSLVVYNDETIASAGTFTNEGETPLWVTTFAEGAPSAPPPAAGEGVSVAKVLHRVNGDEVDVNSLVRGDRLVVSLTLTPGREAETPFIIADLLPAGFEIETILRPNDAGTKGAYSFLGALAVPQVAEARDDQFVAAITTRGKDPVRFAYIVRAVTPGDYTLPGVVTEHMYNPTIYGRSAPGRVSIAP